MANNLRFPAPWTVEKVAGGFKIVDATGLPLAYVYGDDDRSAKPALRALSRVDAAMIAAKIAKLGEAP